MSVFGRWAMNGAIGLLTLSVLGAAPLPEPGNTTNDSTSFEGDPTTIPGRSNDSIVPQRLVWPGIAVIIVIAIFITAALTGPLIRANSSDDPPEEGPAESSDETE
jgi:hypothetical protein